MTDLPRYTIKSRNGYYSEGERSAYYWAKTIGDAEWFGPGLAKEIASKIGGEVVRVPEADIRRRLEQRRALGQERTVEATEGDAQMTFHRHNFAEFTARSDLKNTLEPIARVVQPDKEGPWFVGGAVRRVVADLPQDSDFDVAFASAGQFDAARYRMIEAGLKLATETDNFVEFGGSIDKKQRRIQLLRVGYYDNPEAVLDSFDFTICQFAYDGTDLICGQYALWDLSRKRLALHKLTFGAATVRRIVKYSRQGFTFCQGTIVSILEEVAKRPDVINAQTTYVD